MWLRGRGRGALKAFPLPGTGRGAPAASAGDRPAKLQERQLSPVRHAPEKLLDVRVTEVTDPTSFWAQIEKAESLAAFDNTMAALTTWCEDCGEGTQEMPKVAEVIAVKQGGSWMRAKVTRQVSDREVEVFFIDTGASGRVCLDCVCASSSPLLYAFPQQAFQCSLPGVGPCGGNGVWSEVATARFSELVGVQRGTAVAKGEVLEVEGHFCTLTLFVRREDMLVEVTQVLVDEGLAQPLAARQLDTHKTEVVTREEVEKEEEEVEVEEEEEEEEEVEEEEEEEEGRTAANGDISAGSGPLVASQANGVEGRKGPGGGGKAEQTEKEEGEEEKREELKLVGGGLEEKEQEEHSMQTAAATATTTTTTTATTTASESPLSSDNEWDESLLEPLSDITLSGISVADSPSKPDQLPSDLFSGDPNPHLQQKRANLLAQYKSLMADGEDCSGDKGPSSEQQSSGVWRRGGRGTGRKFGHRFDPGGRGRGGQGRGEGGEWGTGVRRKGNFRGRGQPRPEYSQAGGRVQCEGRAGNFVGVRVASKQLPAGEGRGEAEYPREQQPRRPETPPLPFAPPSSQPVELFKKGKVVEGREGGGVGAGMGVANARVGTSTNGGMTAEKARAEIQWHNWKLESQVKKVVQALTFATVNNFGMEIQSLLYTHGSAQKLRSLPGSRGPVWPVLYCVLTEGVRREGEEERKLMVEAVRRLVGSLGEEVCQLLPPVLENLAVECCEQPSPSKESVQRRQSFCAFIGKLFLDASYSQNRDYASVMGHVIRQYLNTWSKCPVERQELQLVTQVECLSFLCQEIGPTIDVTNRDTLDQYFEGVLMSNVLNVRLPRSVCKLLFQLCLKRAAGWGTGARQADSTPPAPTPSAPPTFSQDMPTLTANGQQVLQPIPVDVPQNRMGIRPLNSTLVDQGTGAHEGYPARPSGASYQAQIHPQTTVQSSFQTANHSSHPYPQTIPGDAMNVPTNSQLSYQTVSSQYQPQPAQPDAYSAVREMLHSLGLPQLLENCTSAMITDSVLECGNHEVLKAGLKDAGFQPGAIISVLDYLERRKSVQSLPPTPSTPLTPHSPLQHQAHYPPYTSHTPNSPAPGATFPPSQQLHQHLHPSPTTPLPSQQHYPHLVAPSLPRPPHQPQQPQQPTLPFSSPPPHPYPLPMRLPPPGPPQPPSEAAQIPRDGHQLSSPAASNPSVRKYGFGAFSCVLCRSLEHRTEQCPDRDSLFFKSS